jgi:hypothetical protein
VDPDQVDDLLPLIERMEPSSPRAQALAEVLLADFLALSIPERARQPSLARDEGVMGTAAHLAVLSSSADLDDVNWSGPFHPGSVVWPVVLALGAHLGIEGRRVRDAGIAGYQLMWLTAKLLGPDHGRQWHMTATAGAVAAAGAASVMHGHDPEATVRALSFALVSLGGLGQAALERRGTAQFTRASASVQGVLAAEMARTAVPAPLRPWSGQRGVQTVMSAAHDVISWPGDPWDELSIRAFPVNGFLQSAVHAAANIGQKHRSQCQELIVELPATVLSLVDDQSTSPWWNARACIAQAFHQRTPFISMESDSVAHPSITLISSDLPVGSSRIFVTGQGLSECYDAPRFVLGDAPADWKWASQKWERTLGRDPDAVTSLARSVLSQSPPWREIRMMWSG